MCEQRHGDAEDESDKPPGDPRSDSVSQRGAGGGQAGEDGGLGSVRSVPLYSVRQGRTAQAMGEPSNNLAELPVSFAATRDTVHRIATHILGRRRHDVSGKFGLRATPGGIGTPAFGAEHEVVRISGTTLVRERTGATAQAASLDLPTATLADAASFAGVDLSKKLCNFDEKNAELFLSLKLTNGLVSEIGAVQLH